MAAFPPSEVLAELTATEPPKGFRVTASRDGYPELTYKTTGMVAVAVFFAVWLTGWTTGCVLMSHQMLFTGQPFRFSQLLLLIIFWGAEFAVIGTVLWLFCSETMITFYPDRLLVERTLHKYQKRWEMARKDIEGVWQIKDGGEGRDSFPSWGLIVAAKSTEIKLLFRQKFEKSAWLGPIVARWAGVEYQASGPR